MASMQPRWDPEAQPGPAACSSGWTTLRQQVHATLSRMTPDTLGQARADGWDPLGPEVAGPLDGLWFALQMVRHSAYHLGQLNVLLIVWEGELEG